MRTLGLFMVAGAMALSASTVNAQAEKKVYYFSFGPTAAMGISRVSGLAGTSRLHPSGAMGIGFVYSRNEHWGYGSQLLLSREGFENRRRINGNEYTTTITPTYIRMPMTVNYFFGKYGDAVRPKIYAGPSIAVKAGERDDIQTMYGMEYSSTNSDLFNDFDLGLQAGAGVNVRLASRIWLNMDLSGYQGLVDVTDMLPATESYNTNQNLRANIGVMFGM